jgi:hypothetical protein
MPYPLNPNLGTPYGPKNAALRGVNRILRGDYAGCVGFTENPQTGSRNNAESLLTAPRSDYPDTKINNPNNTEDDHHGLIFAFSEIKIRQVLDGTSKTYLIGEKYVDALHYDDGFDYVDTESVYSGGNDDNLRTAHPDYPPLPDTPGFLNYKGFGSAHPGGWHALMCDGSVQSWAFDLEPDLHCQNSSRNGETCD